MFRSCPAVETAATRGTKPACAGLKAGWGVAAGRLGAVCCREFIRQGGREGLILPALNYSL
jgi:hypothetical protein